MLNNFQVKSNTLIRFQDEHGRTWYIMYDANGNCHTFHNEIMGLAEHGTHFANDPKPDDDYPCQFTGGLPCRYGGRTTSALTDEQAISDLLFNSPYYVKGE